MTEEEILAMEAGDKLDASVAKEVMGLEVSYLGTYLPFIMVGGGWQRPPYYSTDIEAAWQVWQKMTAQDPDGWAIYSDLEDKVSVEYYPEEYCGGLEQGCGSFHVSGLFPEAICKASLLAKRNMTNEQ